MQEYNKAVDALTDAELRKKYAREAEEMIYEGNRHERRKQAAIARKSKKKRALADTEGEK